MDLHIRHVTEPMQAKPAMAKLVVSTYFVCLSPKTLNCNMNAIIFNIIITLNTPLLLLINVDLDANLCYGNTRENHKVKSKSFNGFNRSNCNQFYVSFFYIVPLQHNAFVISFNQFLCSCGEAAFRLRYIDGRPERPPSVTRVRPDLNLSSHSYTFR